MEGFKDIDAHQYFEKANFFMLELLLKELCSMMTQVNSFELDID